MTPKIKVSITIALLLFCVTVPFILAARADNSAYVFGGFLFNPLDGNTYLAKMQQGFQGDWKFHLTYSPQPGNGAYLFLFYLALGHLARLTGISLIWMFHLARVAASLGMLVALWQFFKWTTQGDEKQAWRCFLWAAVGSGLGWLVSIITGYLSGDFWIPEAYPFLSMFANPHFPLGLALFLWICVLVFTRQRRKIVFIPILSLALAVIQPFSIVVMALPLIGFLLVDLRHIQRVDVFTIAAALLPGGAYVIYQYAAILSDPILAEWNRQNLTLTPPLWDVLVSFSPALLFAIPGAVIAWKSGQRAARTLVFWLASGLVLIYLPFSLQRRFLSGFFVPVIGLAVPAVSLAIDRLRRSAWLWPALLTASVLTNLLLIVSGLAAAAKHDPIIYLTRAEAVGLKWLNQHAHRSAVVLASPRLGMYIPAWSGRSVVFGHPFESLRADIVKAEVEKFLAGKMDEREQALFIQENHIDYYFINLDEVVNNSPGGTIEVFRDDRISIQAVQR